MKRREFMVGTGAMSVGLLLPAVPAFGVDVVRELTGDRKVQESGIEMDIPRIAETGNSVPITVIVDSPMTDADFVRKIHILVPENPEKKAATYTLSPLSGKAEVSTRIRLAKTQTVRAIAEMSDNSVRGTGVNVLVTVGACVEEIWTD